MATPGACRSSAVAEVAAARRAAAASSRSSRAGRRGRCRRVDRPSASRGRPSMSKPSVQTSPTSGAWLTALAASTPGRARSRSTAAAKNAARRLGSASDEPCTDTDIDSTPRGSKPGSMAAAAARLRSTRPAPTSRTSASASSETTNTSRSSASRPWPVVPRAPRRSPMRVRAACQAGTRPKTRPVTIETAEREGQRPALDRHVGGARQVGRRHRRDGAHAERRQGQADDAAQAREQQALDQQLADDLEPRRAEREADGDLRLPRRGARQQHVRDVGAGDQQHEADRDEQHRQAEPRVADDALLERHHLHVAVGARDTPPRGARVTTSTSAWAEAGLTPGFSRAKTRRLSPSRLSRRRVERQRRPQLGVHRPERREHEARRHHADDRVELAVEAHRAADDPRIAAETPLPQAVADHGAARVRARCRRRRAAAPGPARRRAAAACRASGAGRRRARSPPACRGSATTSRPRPCR